MSTIKLTNLKASLLCVAILASIGVQAETQTMPTECTADTRMAEGCMNHGHMNHQGMNHGEMNHGQMNHGKMNHGEMNHGEMNHGQMNHGQMNQGQMNHEGMGHEGMDHDMSGMQGGSAPANARDPHAYSGGYTLTSGPYAMKGPRQLVLADEHIFSSLMVEKLGISREDGNNTKVAEGEFWVGTTWDRLAVGFDADHFDGETEWRVDANWRHAITAFWNTQLGVRHDDS
ncbi:MAG: copper resistance protein B, partial [Oceanobacter sp.]